jgi:ubiquinone/menaquinone biosynthesis C-methylase UbiE
MAAETKKPYRGLGMEGMLAKWYARNTAKSMDDYRRAAAKLAQRLAPASRVLEVAPGPGYLAIALAELGPYIVVGLDISDTFVRLAADNAKKAQVDVDFRRGDAAAMPFADAVFDAVVCRAAFKNFTEPLKALDEMHRVLRAGGFALIVDLDKNAAPALIAEHAAWVDQRLGHPSNTFCSSAPIDRRI